MTYKHTQNKDHIKQQRGARIRLLRMSLRFSRKKFSERHAIKASSLVSWEIGRYGGLTEKAAKKLAVAFQKEGLTQCSPAWLLWNTGAHPLQKQPNPVVDQLLLSDVRSPLNTELELITQEIMLFHQSYPQAIDMRVTDLTMQPILGPDDRIAGQRHSNADIDVCVGQTCIVQTEIGEIMARTVATGDHYGCYHLFTKANPNEPTHKNVRLLYAAPIIWIRKVSAL